MELGIGPMSGTRKDHAHVESEKFGMELQFARGSTQVRFGTWADSHPGHRESHMTKPMEAKSIALS
jgi:hypothetical protein